MRKALLLCCFIMSFHFSQSQNSINGVLATTDPTFNRPDAGAPPTTLSTQGANVYYNLVPLTISTTGLITITCTTSANFDTFGFLYGMGGFDRLNPLTNVLVGDDDSGPGVNFALTYNFTTPGVYYVVVTTFKSGVTGSYSITSNPVGLLPVRLLSFTAEKASAGKNLLKWSSAGEINISKYQVQHSSDGNGFTDVAGASTDARNLSTTSYYTFADNAPFEKLNYYRLKITDKANIVTYSTVAVVNNKSQASGNITVFPNPAVNYLNIQTKAGQKGKADVSITSAAGQIVYTGDYTIVNESILYLDVKKLVAGNYFVRIKTADGETTTLPFIKH